MKIRRIFCAILPFFLALVCFAQRRTLTLETMNVRETTPPPMGLTPIPGGHEFSYMRFDPKGQALLALDAATGQSRAVVTAEQFAAMHPLDAKTKDDRRRDNRARYGVAAYHWSPKGDALLFDDDGRLWFYPLGGAPKAVTGESEEAGDPKFSPDAKYVSFLRHHDLYLRSLAGGEARALTTGGDVSHLHGEVDWLYEEELDVRSNYRWAPDSSALLYLYSDETKVPTYPIVDWMEQHPSTDNIKYPKAGDANPEAKLALVDLEGHSRTVALPIADDDYIPRFGWVKPGLAWALVINRRQNHERLFLIDAANASAREILSEEDARYMELRGADVNFTADGSSFLWMSWRDGHTHIYRYTVDKSGPAKLAAQLTKGAWEVEGIERVDEKKGLIYFVGNKEDARENHIYVVNFDGSKLQRLGAAGGAHSTTLTADGAYYLDMHSSLNAAPVVELCPTAAGECRELWRSHAWDNVERIPAQAVEFKAADGVTTLYGVLMLPKADAPMTVNGKHPIIFNPYGGPGIMTVRDSFGLDGSFDQVLLAHGFAVLKVDNRGGAGRGRDFAAATYGHLGDVEAADQYAALDQLLAAHPEIDAQRVGVWGWSYGGSMTLNLMTYGDRFRAGVAVAPVTDWLLYDSAYTERYMNLPSLNADGYAKSSLASHAANLHGALMIVHGTSDDNVHVQNTLQFIEALNKANKPYNLQLYPRRTHSIAGADARRHLYNALLDHFEKELR